MTTKNDENAILASAKVVKMLPHMFGRNEDIPDSLEGATIVRIGTFDDQSLVEGGGLVIDYMQAGETQVYRLALALNDVAMWVVCHHQIPQSESS